MNDPVDVRSASFAQIDGGVRPSKAARMVEAGAEVAAVLAERGPLSHNELVAETELGYARIGRALQELVRARVVEHAPGGGNGPVRFVYRSASRVVMVGLVEADRIELALADITGRVLSRWVERSPRGIAWADWVVDAATRGTWSQMDALDRASLVGCCLAVSGRVPNPPGSEPTGTMLSRGVSDRLSASCDVIHPAHAKARAVQWDRALGDHDDVVVLDAGDELAAGVVVGGELRVGAGGRAGSVGLLMDEGSGGTTLEERSRFGADEGLDPWFVVAEAATGDELAQARVEDGVVAISKAAGMLLAAYDPDLLVLTGGIAVYPDRIRTAVIDRLGQRIPEPVHERTDVVVTALGRSVALRGAILHALSSAGLDLARPLADLRNEPASR